ncbi:MAG: DUF2723 domain-containing protein [candidate division Zixibacteria bacterium]|nr:DUF2723 domain-containing protein [candidate division Zixibacteria bacterium]
MVKHDLEYSYIRAGRLQRYSDWAIPSAVFFGVLALYIKTMAASIFWGSSAALAVGNSVADLPGIPSSPLYELAARLFRLIPNIDPVMRANLMSAFFSALAVMFFFVIVRRLAEAPILQTKHQKTMLANRAVDLGQWSQNEETLIIEGETRYKPVVVIFPSLAATGLFAISLPVWLSAVRANILALQLFLILLSVLLIFRGVTEKKKFRFCLGVCIYAFSFANQPLFSISFAPAFLYLILVNHSDIGTRNSVLMAGGLAVVVALFGYFSFQGQSILIPTASEYFLRLKKIVLFMASQIGWPLMAIVLFGLWGIFGISRKLFLFFPLAIMGGLAYLLWILDFNPRDYDLVGHLASLTGLILIISSAGFLYLLRLKITAGQASLLMTVLIGIFIYLAAGNNYGRADLSQVTGPEILSREIAKEIPAGGLLLVADDNFFYPMLYSSLEIKRSSQISVIGVKKLSNPTYRQWLKRVYSAITYPRVFLNDSLGHTDELVMLLCNLNAAGHPIYLQGEVPGIDASEIEPSGILFRYVGKKHSVRINKDSQQSYLALAAQLLQGNSRELQTIDFVSRWLFETGLYYEKINNPEAAWQLFNRALAIDVENIEMRYLLAVGLAHAGRFKEALQFVSTALEIVPADQKILKLGRHIIKEQEKLGVTTADN